MPVDKKISELPEATLVDPADYHVIVQSGVTKKVPDSVVRGNNLIAANNLSDVPNKATARTNLGVLSETEVQDLVDNTFGEGFAQPGTPGIPSGTTYQNGFAPHTTYPLRVFSTGYNNKMIVFRGMVDCSGVTFTPGSFIHVFTLPAALRPPIQQHFLVVGLYTSIATCAVHPDGKVYLMNGVAGTDVMVNGIVDLSAVCYYTAA